MEWNDKVKQTEFISLIRDLNAELTLAMDDVKWDLVRKGVLK